VKIAPYLDQLRADVGPHLLNVLRPPDLRALDEAGQRLGGGGADPVVKVELEHGHHQPDRLVKKEEQDCDRDFRLFGAFAFKGLSQACELTATSFCLLKKKNLKI
jgi:hypothetical protein